MSSIEYYGHFSTIALACRFQHIYDRCRNADAGEETQSPPSGMGSVMSVMILLVGNEIRFNMLYMCQTFVALFRYFSSVPISSDIVMIVVFEWTNTTHTLPLAQRWACVCGECNKHICNIHVCREVSLTDWPLIMCVVCCVFGVVFIINIWHESMSITKQDTLTWNNLDNAHMANLLLVHKCIYRNWQRPLLVGCVRLMNE